MLPVLFLMSTGCTLFSPTKELSLTIEGIPEAVESSLRGVWTFLAGTPGGDLYRVDLDWSEGIPETVVFNSPREEDSLFLLYPPDLTEGCGMKPLGAYVASREEGGVLNPRDASAVSLLFTLLQNQMDIENFNCARFLLEMSELPDPWLVEEQTLLKQMGRHEMRSWYIREKTQFHVIIPLGPGTWYSPSYLRKAEVPLEEPQALQLELPRGYGFLYNPEERIIMEYQIDSNGEVICFTRSLPRGASS